jgi:arylsulfatase A-like enzyme
MTGKYPHRFGHENNQPAGFAGGMPASEVTMAEVLRRAGYITGMVGKWHLGYAPGLRPQDQGFATFYGFLRSANEYFPPTTLLRNGEWVTETRYLTDAFGDEAVSFINNNAKRSFYLYLAFNAAHVPLQATQKYLSLPWVKEIPDTKRRTFAAMVAAIDENVGKVHSALKANGLDSRTLIFFTGDNGGAPWAGGNNSPLRGAKAKLFEGGVQTPMFMRWPGTLPSGVRYPHPVSGLDIFPTIAAAAGLAAPSALDGVNLLHIRKHICKASQSGHTTNCSSASLAAGNCRTNRPNGRLHVSVTSSSSSTTGIPTSSTWPTIQVKLITSQCPPASPRCGGNTIAGRR